MSRNTAFPTAIFGGRTGLGFRDARLEERVQMNTKDIAAGTDAIGR